MPITDFLIRNAKDYGADISLIEVSPENEKKENLSWKEFALVETGDKSGYRKEITWTVFNEKANCIANLLKDKGVKKGDKIAILLMNCIEWLPIYFGILKTGAIVVPLNYRYTSDEIKYCLDLADVSMLIFGPEFIERIEEIKNDLGFVNTLLFAGVNCPTFAQDLEMLMNKTSSEEPEICITDEDDAAIYYSSGTTGFPKAILHTHASLVASCITEQKHHFQQKDDVFLCIPPLYHTGAKMHWFGSLLTGGKAILLKGTSPKWIIETASNEKASIVWLLVPWAQDILDALDSGDIKIEDYDLKNWRLMHIGAQPVPPSLIRRWKAYFSNHEYDTNYGLSESTGPGAVHLGVENIHKVGAIGIAGYSWKTKIVDETGIEVPRGSVGELALYGTGVMKCYYKNPEATDEVLKDGWLFTGDMAREDEDGFIYLVDRKKDVIISGGENIYPVQIEDFMRAHEKIRDVAVIGIPHHRLGEIAAAVIEVKPDCVCSEEEILEFCSKLPKYKRPRQVIFDNVPRNPTGKIEKPRLRDKYSGGSIVEIQIRNGKPLPK